MAVKIIVRWITRDPKAIEKIRARFHFPSHTTLNGWTPGFLPADDLDIFNETVRRGFISFIECEWEICNGHYGWSHKMA